VNTLLLPDITDGIMRHANSGGPGSRTRREHLASSLLGSDDGIIRCAFRIRLGLKFEDTHPVDCLEAILKAEGLRDPEELRNRYDLPQVKLICGPVPDTAERLPVFGSQSCDVLEQALMLGLCTAQVFDPGRPVLWTETSLTRSVELFDPRGFYA
jgi:hypothetical protein